MQRGESLKELKFDQLEPIRKRTLQYCRKHTGYIRRSSLSIFAIDHAVIRSRYDIVNGLRYSIVLSNVVML